MSDYVEHLVDYPFSKEMSVLFDDEGGTFESLEWRPGCIQVKGDNYGCGCEINYEAHGIGEMVLTEISRHKLPRPYPERVFYVREWIAPSGRRFGKKILRVMSVAGFTRLCSGYRHQFDLADEPPSMTKETT